MSTPRHANPLPLGFLALAGATLVVSGLQLGWLAKSEAQSVALVLLAFAFPLQLIASVFGFLRAEIVPATAMAILAGTWLSVGLVTLTSPPGATSDALGLFLLLAAVAMAVPASAAAEKHRLAVAVLSITVVRFAVTGIYELTGNATWKDLAGIAGLVLCAAATTVAATLALRDSKGSGPHTPQST